ncbi:Cathepsin F-like peptidase [Aphelenchoides besseyi]|nr:Cathepsin F-like peptidase [Aphelenchoides besseyi]KAI6195011.1 Cathepsin F-like peptidase [Aphelenchoides besseyi]
MRLGQPRDKSGAEPLIPNYKLKPFHAYQEFLAKVAILCAAGGIFALAFLIIATNLPLKEKSEQWVSDELSFRQNAHDPTFDDHYDSFKKFMFKYGRRYENVEQMTERFSAFRQNLRQVKKLNHLETLTNTEFGLNDFADISDEEFQKMLLPVGSRKSLRSNATFIQPFSQKIAERASLKTTYPKHFDWRTKNVVTPVKAQKNCGSCWSFATAATVETSYAIAHGELRNLSEQELLDCNLENNACNGGDVDKALRFVREYGLMLEEEYPYVAHRQNSCFLHDSPTITKIDVAYFINPDENAIIEWLVTFGPVNVGINVPKSMKLYKGGVYRPSDWECQFDVLGSHALNIMGYGTSEDGEKYWIIKNSWGQQYGIEGGYINFARGVNACGVEDEPVGVLA